MMQQRVNWRNGVLLVIGLDVMAAGIALMVYAGLGTSPVSSMPYVMSLRFTSISLGTFTFLWNLLLILAQPLLIGREFRPFQLLQLPLTLLFGCFVDLNKWLLRPLEAKNYAASLVLLALGCAVVALGATCTLVADVIMNSGEAFVAALAKRLGKEFGLVKVGVDVSLVLLAMFCSWLFFGRVVGVREGTIFAAVVSGFLIRAFTPPLRRLTGRWLSRTRA